MKVFIIGGTGLIGSAAAKQLLKRGHEVWALALPPIPEGAQLPAKMSIEYGNYMDMTEEELASRFSGFDGLVFAAGIDERVEGPPPVYDMFKKYNIDPLEKMLRAAKKSGITSCVICGSYFCYFNRMRPSDKLSLRHPYIRSRVDQEMLALSFAAESFNVAVLEIPYIFGAQPGRKPVWVFLVESLLAMKGAAFYPRGGTAIITVRQAGQAVAGALERNRGGAFYPLGYYNLSWRELLALFHKHMGCPGKPVITIPNWMFALGARRIARGQKARGIEGGLDLNRFSALQCSRQFIDRSLGCDLLGVTEDDLDAAVGESIRLSLEFLRGKKDMVDMLGEPETSK